MLNQTSLAELKAKLENTKKDLEGMIKELKVTPEFGSDVDHFEEEVNEAEEFSANLGKIKLFKNRLMAVNQALQKIAKGSYGRCEKCGQEIDPNILKIDPESLNCRECKLKHDN